MFKKPRPKHIWSHSVSIDLCKQYNPTRGSPLNARSTIPYLPIYLQPLYKGRAVIREGIESDCIFRTSESYTSSLMSVAFAITK